jgi:peptide/nickel transport system permease protein
VQYNLMLHAYGFDKPIPVQYLVWLKHLFTGQNVTDGTSGLTHCSAPCLGYSFRLNTSVTALIGAAVPVSLSLAFGASVLWLFGGLLVGTISGLRPGSIVDRIGMTLALGAVSIPIFFTGPILLLIFVYQLKWLPNVTYAGITDDPLQWLKSMILPWIALALAFAALYARLTRANMMEVMSEDYIRTARAKGLPRRTVVVRHGLRSALTPIVTIFGIDLGTLIGSTVITEQVFNLRGLGHLTIQGLSQQDLPVIMGVTIIAAIALVVANLLVDIVYAVVDPRVSYS